ncbi:protein kinase domain-containing protein [Bacillus cereus]|uniref:protein kinase domain-containing protein n=1 Tax=Bacillus cereus TaxID=1396 RepID=UPI000D6417CF
MCNVISFAHKKNIIYKDIKPLNIFISKFSVVRVEDFGLVKFKNVISRTYTGKIPRSEDYT